MAAEHFTYLSGIIGDADTEKFVTAIALGGGLAVLGSSLTARLRTAGAVQSAVIPAPKLDLFGFFDFFVEAFTKFHDSIVGKENRKYVSFTGSVFLFLLLANLLGLVPGMPSITTTVWVNVGMALAVFLYFNGLGVKEHGLVGYLKHFAGPIWWLAWFLFPLEIFSTTLRILTLNLRLYWNVTADHMVLEILTGLLGLGAVPIYVLGTFVSFMQAFVFTILTMVYIRVATQHEEGHDHH